MLAHFCAAEIGHGCDAVVACPSSSVRCCPDRDGAYSPVSWVTSIRARWGAPSDGCVPPARGGAFQHEW